MARINKLGTSFCGLDLEPAEERKLQRWLKYKGLSAKAYFRHLIRKEITAKNLDFPA